MDFMSGQRGEGSPRSVEAMHKGYKAQVRRRGGDNGSHFTELEEGKMLYLNTQNINQGGNLAIASSFLLPHSKLPTVM